MDTQRKPQTPEAVKYGRLFSDKSDEMQMQLKMEAAQYYSIEHKNDGSEKNIFYDRERFDRCELALAALAAAQSAVDIALDAWNSRDPLFIENADPAKFLLPRVQEAWHSAGNKMPKDVGVEGKLCIFIRKALILAGREYTTYAISDVLRGKNQRLSLKPRRYVSRAADA